MAAWMVIIGSAVVVMTVWEQISGLRSLETRESIEALLAEPFAEGLGLDVESVIQVLHVSAMVTAGLATAAAVLGWHVLQRNLAARLALTVLALPLFITGMTSGGFVSSLVAASVVMLWLSPAREWFSTGSWTMPTPPRAAEAAPPATWPAPPPTPDTEPGGADRPAPRPPVAPYSSRPASDEARAPLHDRPASLVAAFVVTVVGAGLVLAMVSFSVLVMAFSPELLTTEIERQRPDLLEGDVSVDQLRYATFVVGAICMAWCSAALLFAGFAMARLGWARTALVVTAAASAGACLLASLYTPVALVPGLAALATVLLLRRPEVRTWFGRPVS
jgi:hypothetical protein